MQYMDDKKQVLSPMDRTDFKNDIVKYESRLN